MADEKLTKFEHFPKLPLEVRDMIWKLAAHQKKQVVVQIVEKRFKDFPNHSLREEVLRHGEWDLLKEELDAELEGTSRWRQYALKNEIGIDDGLSYTFRLVTATPGILHACRESRKEALKWYKTCFEGEYEGTRAIYLNPVSDSLFIRIPRVEDDWISYNIIPEFGKEGESDNDMASPWKGCSVDIFHHRDWHDENGYLAGLGEVLMIRSANDEESKKVEFDGMQLDYLGITSSYDWDLSWSRVFDPPKADQGWGI